jgi:fructose-1,6-bisphosphatase-3
MSNHDMNMACRIEADRRILELLSQTFPSQDSASTEIINLEAILRLPKGTEHFVADIHGEHEAFQHILKNASGNIRRKVNEIFQDLLLPQEIKELCTLIYYPEEKLELIEAKDEDSDEFYSTTLQRLVLVLRSVSSKYTRSKVRKALPMQFAYIIEELLHEKEDDDDKTAYLQGIIDSIIQTDQAKNFITAMCHVIQQLSIDQLHILGDIWDRGPGAHIIMDTLLQYHNFDITWGNHDALWMGAAAGNDCCICNVLRFCLRFGNMDTLEEGYGINLLPLAQLAMEAYKDDPATIFLPERKVDERQCQLIGRMHKAITVIQFKLEHEMIEKHPEWVIDRTETLGGIDIQRGVYVVDGNEYPLRDTLFPTIQDWNEPYRMTLQEKEMMAKLHHSFRISDKLQKHIKCILSRGGMYNICNGNLLFHASVPLNDDGSLKEIMLMGKRYCGKELMNRIGIIVRSAFNTDTPRTEKLAARDYLLYLWCGPESPLFDKSRMTTFQRYLVGDKQLIHEEKGAYFRLRNDEDVCNHILDSFGVQGKHRHIINGHVPVHVSAGESPIKANGRLMVIDGGFSQHYHSTTGIAGYTLVFHSRGFELIQHEPFTSKRDAIQNGSDIHGSIQLVELSGHRIRVRDTDHGRKIQKQIAELRELLYAYRHGYIRTK